MAASGQLQPLADDEEVRVAYLMAVGPPHGGPVGRIAVAVAGDRGQRVALVNGVAGGGLMRCRMQRNRDRHQELYRSGSRDNDHVGMPSKVVRQKVPALCCEHLAGTAYG